METTRLGKAQGGLTVQALAGLANPRSKGRVKRQNSKASKKRLNGHEAILEGLSREIQAVMGSKQSNGEPEFARMPFRLSWRTKLRDTCFLNGGVE